MLFARLLEMKGGAGFSWMTPFLSLAVFTTENPHCCTKWCIKDKKKTWIIWLLLRTKLTLLWNKHLPRFCLSLFLSSAFVCSSLHYSSSALVVPLLWPRRHSFIRSPPAAQHIKIQHKISSYENKTGNKQPHWLLYDSDMTSLTCWCLADIFSLLVNQNID